MVDHVYLLFDGDTAGRKGVERLKDRFGGKVTDLQIPETDGEVPDITDWVVKFGADADSFIQLVKESRGSLLLTVDDAFNEHQLVQGATGIQFGVEKLDLILKPGLLHNQLMVVLAKSGTGKRNLK